MATCLIDLSTITNETLPLIWVFVSIILSGNIIRLIYFANKDKIREQSIIRIKDTIVLTSGLAINWITLNLMKVDYSFESFKVYNEAKTWLYIGIATLILGFLTWEYRCKGKKWLKDTVGDIISLVLGILFVILAITFIGNIISFTKQLSLDNTTELISNGIKIIFSICMVLFSGYAALKLLNIKSRRYPKPWKKQ